MFNAILFIIFICLVFLFKYTYLISVHVFLYYFTLLFICMYYKFLSKNNSFLLYNFFFIFLFFMYFWSVTYYFYYDINYIVINFGIGFINMLELIFKWIYI